LQAEIVRNLRMQSYSIQHQKQQNENDYSSYDINLKYNLCHIPITQ